MIVMFWLAPATCAPEPVIWNRTAAAGVIAKTEEFVEVNPRPDAVSTLSLPTLSMESPLPTKFATPLWTIIVSVRLTLRY